MEYVCRDIGPNFVIPQFQTESNKEQDWTPISFLFTTHQGEAKVTFNSNKNQKIKNKHKWTKYKKPTKAIIHFSNVSDRIVPMLPIFYHYLSSKSLHFLHKFYFLSRAEKNLSFISICFEIICIKIRQMYKHL